MMHHQQDYISYRRISNDRDLNKPVSDKDPESSCLVSDVTQDHLGVKQKSPVSSSIYFKCKLTTYGFVYLHCQHCNLQLESWNHHSLIKLQWFYPKQIRSEFVHIIRIYKTHPYPFCNALAKC